MYVTSVISESKLFLIRGGKGVVEGKWGGGGGGLAFEAICLFD